MKQHNTLPAKLTSSDLDDCQCHQVLRPSYRQQIPRRKGDSCRPMSPTVCLKSVFRGAVMTPFLLYLSVTSGFVKAMCRFCRLTWQSIMLLPAYCLVLCSSCSFSYVKFTSGPRSYISREAHYPKYRGPNGLVGRAFGW